LRRHSLRAKDVKMAGSRRSGGLSRFEMSIVCGLLGRAVLLGEVALGPEAMAAYMETLGRLAGLDLEQSYRKRWDEWATLSPAKYGFLVTDLFGRMGGRTSLAAVDAEKVVVDVEVCPYSGASAQAPALCVLDGAVFGTIAARNFGYAKVSVEHGARLPGSCRVTIFIRPTPAAEGSPGMEFSGVEAGTKRMPADLVDTLSRRVASAGFALRQTLLGLDVPVERTGLLEDAAGLFLLVESEKDVCEEAVRLAIGPLGQACALYLLGEDGSKAVAVRHANPQHSEPLRALLGGEDPRSTFGRVGSALVECRPVIAGLADPEECLSPEAVQALSAMGLASALVAPVTEPTGSVGAILCMAGSGRHLGPSDLQLASRYGRLVGAALFTARGMRAHSETIAASRSFASAAFHELLNGLAKLKSLVQLNERALAEDRPDGVQRVQRNLELMGRHLDLLAGLTRDVSDAFSITTMEFSIKRERLNLTSLVTDVVERFRAVVHEHSPCRLEAELPDEQIVGVGDRWRLEQLITNLLANAVNYSPNGGRITVSLRLERPSGEGETVGRHAAVITVADEGIGIPEDQISQVFAPFARARNASDSHKEGAGLGLFICQGIARAHGGRLWLESRLGQGSTFHFSMPVEGVRVP